MAGVDFQLASAASSFRDVMRREMHPTSRTTATTTRILLILRHMKIRVRLPVLVVTPVRHLASIRNAITVRLLRLQTVVLDAVAGAVAIERVLRHRLRHHHGFGVDVIAVAVVHLVTGRVLGVLFVLVDVDGFR